MTAQEQQMIQGLADRINKTPLAEKDPDAERFLQGALGRNPDALYILAQTVLVQQYALEQAQRQLADARAQMAQQRQQAPEPKHATSFLGNLLGLGEDHARPAAPPPPPAPSQQYGQPAYAPMPQQYGPGYGIPQQGGFGQAQTGGFLRSAMQTATGVAAGALAFEGIESLMHGFGGSGGGSGFNSGMGGGRPEEIVNNYYGDSASGEHGGNLSSDIEDRRGERSSFDDAVANDDHHDGLMDASNRDTDDSGVVADDSGSDDGSSFDSGADDGGSDDTNF